MIRAHELEGTLNQYHYSAPHPHSPPMDPHSDEYDQPEESNYSYDGDDMPDELEPMGYNDEYARQVVEEEGAFSPSEQQFVARQQHADDDFHDDHYHGEDDDEEVMMQHYDQRRPVAARMDPPEDEPPSLKRGDEDSYYQDNASEDMNKPPDSEWDDPEHQLQDEEYYESREVGKYYVTSDESPSMLSEGMASPPSAVSPSEADYDDPSPNHHQTSPRHRSSDLPPISPRSPVNSDVYSQHSSAMKGAQELLRRNRQRRAATAASQMSGSQPSAKPFVSSVDPATHGSDEQDEGGGSGRAASNLGSPHTDSESGNTWESGSDFTGSSAWTDGSFANPDRSSRRALILQMAKARMKSNKKTEEKKMDELDLGGELD
jgi:hypothetical protein